MKRWFRGPWLWVVLFAIVVLVVLNEVSSRNGFEDVDTSELVHTLKTEEVKSVVFVDGDQEIQVTLEDGRKIQAQWLGDQGNDLLDEVQQQVEAGNIKESYDVEVPVRGSFSDRLRLGGRE